jgi:hypothetical protein
MIATGWQVPAKLDHCKPHVWHMQMMYKKSKSNWYVAAAQLLMLKLQGQHHWFAG